MLAPVSSKPDLAARLRAGPSPTAAVALPTWALWFHHLGGEVADEGGGPLTYAFSLPTRSFAAVLTAFGLVRGRCCEAAGGTGHFEQLWNGDPGVTVRYRQGTREFRGALVGKEERGGIRYLVIQRGATAKDRVPENMAHNILSVGAVHKRPQKSSNLSIRDPWLALMLEGCDEGSYQFHNRHDCLLVGQDSVLREEAELKLHVEDGARRSLSGTLGCVLRVKRWQAATKAYTCEVLPQSTEREEVALELLQSFHAVVFDGAAAYLRWRGPLSGQHHIVLLDRTETRFAEAAEAVNQALVKRQGALLPLPDDLPTGVEGVAFRRGA